MPGNILHVGATIQCPHGGAVQATAIRGVRLQGQVALAVSDVCTVMGCPFQIATPSGPKPQPCVRVQWQSPAMAIGASGPKLLLTSSIGTCYSAEGIVQGVASILRTQTAVRGS